MTTELEEQFFKVFWVKPKQLKICRNINHCPNKYKICNDKCKNWHVVREIYPEITDRKLLEMICILSAYNHIFEDLKADNIEQLKEEIIKLFFDYPLIAEESKTKIQQLFKEKE